MIFSSVILMTCFDLLIVGACIYAGISLIRNRRVISEHAVAPGFLFVLAGLITIGLFYLADLLAMHLLPKFIPMADAMAVMTSLHLEYNWYVFAASATAIAVGFARNILDVSRFTSARKNDQERFQDIAEIASDWIWEMDSELRFSFLTDRYFEISGFTPEQVIGKTRPELAGSKADTPEWRQHLDDIENHRAFRDFEYTTRLPDGSDGHFQIRGNPVFAENGDFLGYRGTGTDQTREVEARRALEESEKHFRDLIEGSIQGVLIHSNWDILFANQALADIFGYSSQLEILDQVRVEKLIAPNDVERLQGYLKARLKGQPAPENYEVECIRKNGSRIWAEFRNRHTQWRGQPAIQCVVVDITERRNAGLALQKHNEELRRRDHALREQNERFNAALDNMSQALAMFDFDQRLIVSNERFATMYGLAPDAIQPGMLVQDILNLRIENGIYTSGSPEAYVKERVEWGESDNSAPTIHHLNDGRYIEIKREMLSGGGWLTTHEDITERSKAEAALQAQNERFNLALSNMTQALVMFDKDKRLIVCNERFATMYGLSPEQIKPGMAMDEVIELRIASGNYCGDDPEEYRQERRAWAAARDRATKTMRLNDGRTIEIKRVVMSDGGWLATHQDVTERCKAEAALKQQNEWFNLALGSMTQGLCMFDGEQRLIVSNKRYARMYNLSPKLMKPGITLREILEHRIANGIYSGSDPEAYIQERLEWVTSGVRASKVQELSDGRAIAITHEPMRDGGWLTTHEDITERRKTQDLLRATIANFPGGISVFDADLTLTMANRNFYRVLDLPEETLPVGVSYEDIIRFNAKRGDYGDGDPEEMVRERVALAKKFEEHAFERRRPDGTVVEIRGFPLPEGGFVTTYVDVTERKTAEAQNLRLARIVEDSINEVYVFDAETLKFRQVNASACKNLGYTELELYELTPVDLKPKYTRAEFEKLISPLRSEALNHLRFQTVHKRKDGSLYSVDIILQQIQSKDRPVFAAIVEDITERKKAEAALRENEQLFSKAFHANPIPLSISAPDGVIHDVNEAWLTNLGYTREETIGYSSLKLGIWASPDERAEYVERLKKNGVVKAFEAQYLTKSGEARDMLVSGEYVEVCGERLMFNLSHDVTDSKRANRELVQHRDQLQELVDQATVELKEKAKQLEQALTKEKKLNELQRQFVSTASHEFRTPLAIIDSSVQRLMRSKNKLTPDVLEARTTRIRDAVKVMSDLMESTLSAASMDSGAVKMTLAPCDLRAIITAVCDRQKDMKDDRKIRFDPGDIPDRIESDQSILNQIFTNLLANAVKYSSDGSEIKITGRREGNDVAVLVRDHGIGIDEDDLPKMFTRFFRAKTSTGIAGTGIGLNLVKTLVEMQGGSVSVESVKGEGSTFSVRLPINGPSHKELTGIKVA